MEAILVILGLALLIGAVLGWVALFSTLRQENDIRALKTRLSQLEGRIARQSVESAPETSHKPRPKDTPQTEQAAALRQTEPQKLAPPETSPIKPTVSKSANPIQPAKLVSPKAAPKSAKLTKPKMPAIDLEGLLGGKASVWVGGIALLLGAVLLLRYSIEAGLVTPAVRVALAALLGIVALGASELAARRGLGRKAFGALADLPAVLAAIGVFSLFGAVYAAHALYGLLGASPAFLGMGAVALGAMAMSLRLGPALAGIGLIGALTVPFLVASVQPSYLGVFTYVGIVTAAAFGVSHLRKWDWLYAAATVGLTAWLMILAGKASTGLQSVVWAAAHAAALTLTWRAVKPQLGKYDDPWVLLGKGGLILLAGLAGFFASQNGGPDISRWASGLYALAIFAAFIALLWRQAERRMVDLVALITAAFTVPLIWRLAGTHDPSDILTWLRAGIVTTGLTFGALILSQRSEDDIWARIWGVVGAGLAAFGVFEALSRFGPGDVQDPLIAFALAGVFAAAALLQTRTPTAEGAALGGVLLWALGLSEMTAFAPTSIAAILGLALMLGLAVKRDALWLRLAALGMAGLAGMVGLGALDAAMSGQDVIGDRPGLNALWLYFGLPGLLCAGGAALLERRQSRDLGTRLLMGGGVTFTIVLVSLLIHHAMNDGDLGAPVGFAEQSLQILVALAAMVGGSWSKGSDFDWPGHGKPERDYILPVIAIAFSSLTLLVFTVYQLMNSNPLFNSAETVPGHPVFNALILAYLAPALLLALAAWRYSETRPKAMTRTAAGLALVSGLVWMTAQIRVATHGEKISIWTVDWTNAELYAVSAAWLATAIVLLGIGAWLRRRDVRIASAVLMLITTLKVFLVDLSELEGALRALSFIGLGIVLLGIGALYQRVLLPRDHGPSADRAKGEAADGV